MLRRVGEFRDRCRLLSVLSVVRRRPRRARTGWIMMVEVASRVIVSRVDSRGVGRNSGGADRLGLIVIESDLFEAPSRGRRWDRRGSAG